MEVYEMSSVAVQKLAEPGKTGSSLQTEIEALFDKIREKAFEIFQRKGGADGHDIDDWLEAEREFLCCPASELVETEKQFEIRVAAPGFEPKDIEVTASPDAIIVRGQVRTRQEKVEESVRFSDLSEKHLFRRMALPEPIDVDSASARLDEGLLNIVATKASASSKTAVAA
jgi:HSP20 family protein